MKKIDFTKFNSLLSVADYFNTVQKCKQALTETRWGDDIICPKCGKHHSKPTGGYVRGRMLDGLALIDELKKKLQ